MLRSSTPYRQLIYAERISTATTNKPIEDIKKNLQIKAKMQFKLRSLICSKLIETNSIDESRLSDADYRDILERLHYDNNAEFHQELDRLGLANVSRYSIFSNQRATGKIEALKEHLSIADGLPDIDAAFLINENSDSHSQKSQNSTQLLAFRAKSIFDSAKEDLFDNFDKRKLLFYCLDKPEFFTLITLPDLERIKWTIESIVESVPPANVTLTFAKQIDAQKFNSDKITTIIPINKRTESKYFCCCFDK